MADQAMCSVHGKMRSGECLMESPTGLVCRPDKQCRTAGGDKSVPCKFWQEGRCTKGAACPFGHHGGGGGGGGGWGGWGPSGGDMWSAMGMGKGDMWGMMGGGKGKGGGKGSKGGTAEPKAMCAVHQKQRSISTLQALGDGTYCCIEGNECQTAADSGVKRSLCKFFQQGACQRGSACAFAHHESEIGQPIPEEALVKAIGASADGPVEQLLCSTHSKMRSATCLVDNGDGTFACKAGFECKGAGEKRTMCKFWAQGKCDKGDDCTFAHDPNAPTGEPAKGKGKGKDAGWGNGGGLGPMDMWSMMSEFAWGKGMDWGMGGKGMGGMGGKGGKGKGGKSKGGFSGWGAGGGGGEEGKMLCTVHNKMRSAPNLQDNGDGTFSCKMGCECRDTGASGGTQHVPCKFFAQGKCEKGSDCPFSHEVGGFGYGGGGFGPKGCGKSGGKHRFAPY